MFHATLQDRRVISSPLFCNKSFKFQLGPIRISANALRASVCAFTLPLSRVFWACFFPWELITLEIFIVKTKCFCLFSHYRRLSNCCVHSEKDTKRYSRIRNKKVEVIVRDCYLRSIRDRLIVNILNVRHFGGFHGVALVRRRGSCSLFNF